MSLEDRINQIKEQIRKIDLENLEKVAKKTPEKKHKIIEQLEGSKIANEAELESLLKNSIDERDIEKTKTELEKLIVSHSLLHFAQKTIDTMISSTNDKDLLEFFNTIKDYINKNPLNNEDLSTLAAEEPTAVSGDSFEKITGLTIPQKFHTPPKVSTVEITQTEKLKRVAEFQRLQKIEEKGSDYTKQEAASRKTAFEAISDTTEKFKEKEKIRNLLNNIENSKNNNEILKAIVLSIKKYSELKKDYKDMILDYYNKASSEDFASGKTTALKELYSSFDELDKQVADSGTNIMSDLVRKIEFAESKKESDDELKNKILLSSEEIEIEKEIAVNNFRTIIQSCKGPNDIKVIKATASKFFENKKYQDYRENFYAVIDEELKNAYGPKEEGALSDRTFALKTVREYLLENY